MSIFVNCRKCRLEGEITVQAGRCPELNYSLMDEHGGLNEGVVTPADMLSFARQVAMAMVCVFSQFNTLFEPPNVPIFHEMAQLFLFNIYSVVSITSDSMPKYSIFAYYFI